MELLKLGLQEGLCIIIIIDGEVVCCEGEVVRCEGEAVRCGEGDPASDLQGHRRNRCDWIVTLSIPTFSSLCFPSHLLIHNPFTIATALFLPYSY